MSSSHSVKQREQLSFALSQFGQTDKKVVKKSKFDQRGDDNRDLKVESDHKLVT
jgi:hypothetical protein